MIRRNVYNCSSANNLLLWKKALAPKRPAPVCTVSWWQMIVRLARRMFA